MTKLIEPELEMRMHKMEVVCKIAIQTRAIGRGSHARANLGRIGLYEFGLLQSDVNKCLGRARDMLAEVAERDCVRNRRLIKFKIAA